MSVLSREAIIDVLSSIEDQYLGKALEENQISALEINASNVELALTLAYPAGDYKEMLATEVKTTLSEKTNADVVKITINQKVSSHSVQKTLKRIEGIKNIIAIASGKGGVGKSTTTANLALALAADGASVGILDADIYGPSQPRMLGMSGRPHSDDGKTIDPKENHGIKAMSIGFLVDEDTPMIWRGPMVTQALEQLLNDTNWGELDYLLIDLPPGTGDTQLTLSQKIPVSGAVIVTTPQDIALLDARKGLNMFEKVEVPVLGVVENMSMHICSECGHMEHIFGEGGGQRMADESDVNFLGSLPLDLKIRQQADDGMPTVASEPTGEIAKLYKDISRKMSAKLALQAKDYSNKFPNIVIQDT